MAGGQRGQLPKLEVQSFGSGPLCRYNAAVLAPPFNQYLGIHVDRMEGGEAVARIELGPHHTNNRGVAHGGVVLSLLDSAMGAAVISAIPKEWWCATTGLSVQFLTGPRQ